MEIPEETRRFHDNEKPRVNKRVAKRMRKVAKPGGEIEINGSSVQYDGY